MTQELTHAGQYEMLRAEIMQQLGQMHRTQIWALTATGATYAWLSTQAGVPRGAWFIAPGIVLFCALRTWSITLRMRSIAGYLRRIEKAAFASHTELPGWERYLESQVGHFTPLSPAVLGMVFWPFLLLLSIVASWVLSR